MIRPHVIAVAWVGLTACTEPAPLRPEFVVGANLPWWNYGGDVGGNAWGHYGASTHADDVDAVFDELSQAGLHEVRWFVFGDGRASPEFDGDTPTGLQPRAWDDLDVVFDAAARHDMGVVAVLFDYTLCSDAQVVDGVQIGGRDTLITEPGPRRGLINRVLIPLAQRYDGHPGLRSWELINEPEWAAQGMPGVSAVGDEVMTVFVDEVGEAMADVTSVPLTVGSSTMDAAAAWTRAPLDEVHVHWYRGALPDAADLSSTMPVFLGEFSANEDVTDVMMRAQANGFAGAYPWSLQADDGHGPLDLSAFVAPQ